MNASTNVLWQRVRHDLAHGHHDSAQALLKAILAIDPQDVQAHLHLGQLHAARDQPRAAAARALAAAQVPIADAGMLVEVAGALLRSGEIVATRQLLNSPLIAASRSIPVLMRAAGQRQAMGEHAEALALMERARTAGASGREFLFHHGIQLAFNGHIDSARNELERCVGIDPPLGRAFIELARMAKPTPEFNHLDRIEAALQQATLRDLDHAALEFARYRELSGLQRYDEAWNALVRGNAMMHELLPYDAARQAVLFDRLIATCDAALPTPPIPRSKEDPQPIFVIGLPRSGTTVLERMLGNHSRIASAGELGDLPRAVTLAVDHVARVMFDEITLTRLTEVDWGKIGQSYLAQTTWRARGKQWFVDKLPRNWMFAGLIPRALPAARIVHVVRDPMDVCFSNWRALFGPGAEYAYSHDLAAVADQYRHYRRLMTHWHTVAPGHILDVEYSSLVRAPAQTLRRILAFCGLEFEPACADLTRNTGPSATLSMAQVRQPVRNDTSRQWQAFRPQLAGLQARLTGLHG